jgi:hypothetical protein
MDGGRFSILYYHPLEEYTIKQGNKVKYFV